MHEQVRLPCCSRPNMHLKSCAADHVPPKGEAGMHQTSLGRWCLNLLTGLQIWPPCKFSVDRCCAAHAEALGSPQGRAVLCMPAPKMAHLGAGASDESYSVVSATGVLPGIPTIPRALLPFSAC